MESWYWEKAYLISDSAAHRRNHSYASTITPSDHLLGYCLRCHEGAGNVDLLSASAFPHLRVPVIGSSDLKHSVSILSRILQRARLLLYSRRRDQPIKLALAI